jgi:AraC-like DNA-binding protein
MEMMFHYKKSFLVRKVDEESDCQPNAFLSGMSSSFSDVSTRGETGMFSVSFLPAGACRFFNFPLGDIENRNLNLELVCRQEARIVNEKLYHACSAEARTAIVEEFLLGKLKPYASPDFRMIQEGIRLIDRRQGLIRAEELGKTLLTTPRTLERKFSNMVGKSPKQFIRIVRFQHILNSVQGSKSMNFTRLAYDRGYFDQAHFINDFKIFTGMPPKEFFTKYPCNQEPQP